MSLNAKDRARLHAALSDAEERTGLNFASVIVPVSDRYPLYPVAWAGAASLMAGAIMAFARPYLELRVAVPLEFAVFAAFALVFDWLPLRLRLVPRRVKQRKARDLAHHAFAARVLAPAHKKNGVLLFVSIGERTVQILASADVHGKIGDEMSRKIVADFTGSARRGKIAEGAIAAIQAYADRLAARPDR